MRRIILFIGFLLTTACAEAQLSDAVPGVFVVEHTQRLRSYRYRVGDAIRLRWRGEPSDRSGSLAGLRADTLLVIDRRSEQLLTIPLREVSAVVVSAEQRRTRLPQLVGGALATYGAAALAVTAINRSSQGLNPVVPVGTLTTHAALLATGLAVGALSGQKALRLGRRWQARVLDLGLTPRARPDKDR